MAAPPFRPKKSLGQNFLIDSAHRARIVAAADLTRHDAVLEIGAGDGSLTALIAAEAGRVVAVELDRRLIPVLQKRFASQPHVKVIHGDILEMEIGELMRQTGPECVSDPPRETAAATFHFKVIANLPYYITATVIRKLLESANPPGLLVLTVQREVAERIVASPPRMSLLAVSVQYYCTAQVVDRIPAEAFHPPPKVDSAALRLFRRCEPLFSGLAAEDFFRVVRAGFCQPRKQLRNALALGMGVSPAQAIAWLQAAEVSPQRRAESLALDEWGRLSDVVTQRCNNGPAVEQQ
jgi:16S rRNA (adenine1518-N6/adenine1519-N6)-dimethyltransferase